MQIDLDTVQQAETWAREITSYHKPDEAQIAAITAIRQATADLLVNIRLCCPAGADRDHAINHAREAMMHANAAIVFPQQIEVLPCPVA